MLILAMAYRWSHMMEEYPVNEEANKLNINYTVFVFNKQNNILVFISQEHTSTNTTIEINLVFQLFCAKIILKISISFEVQFWTYLLSRHYITARVQRRLQNY